MTDKRIHLLALANSLRLVSFRTHEKSVREQLVHQSKKLTACKSDLSVSSDCCDYALKGLDLDMRQLLEDLEKFPQVTGLPGAIKSAADAGTAFEVSANEDKAAKWLTPSFDQLLWLLDREEGACQNTSSSFPVTEVQEAAGIDYAVSKLAVLCENSARKAYTQFRDEYCEVSIHLNLLGRRAPAFRPILNSGASRGDQTLRNQVLRDQMVIDLHWCQATNMSLNPIAPRHQAMFDKYAIFPFDEAYELAGDNLRSGGRISQAMGLTILQQCQLLRIRGNEVTARQKNLNAGWQLSARKRVSKFTAAKRQISQWAYSDQRIKGSRWHYETLWLARELLGPDTTAAQIGALHVLMDESLWLVRITIEQQLKKLDKMVKLH